MIIQKPKVLYLQSEELNHGRFRISRYGPDPETIDSKEREEITRTILSRPLVERTFLGDVNAGPSDSDWQREIYLHGRHPERYDITIRDYQNARSFLDAILTHPGKIDEFVINGHGEALYLKTDGMATDKLDTSSLALLRERILADPERWKGIVSVDDLRLSEDETRRIRRKFSRNAFCTSYACSTFDNLGTNEPVFGIELARLLNVPVIGSVPKLNWGEANYGDVKQDTYFSAERINGRDGVVTAFPINGRIEIRHAPRKPNYVYNQEIPKSRVMEEFLEFDLEEVA